MMEPERRYMEMKHPEKKAEQMTQEELASYIDYSVLKPEFTEEEIIQYIGNNEINVMIIASVYCIAAMIFFFLFAAICRSKRLSSLVWLMAASFMNRNVRYC